MYVFFFTILLVPVITHKSHVMSAHPCLQVHDCISACLSCMFECPCAFLHVQVCLAAFCWHVHVCMSMSPWLHLCMVSMLACSCLHACWSVLACPSPCLTFLRFCSCHYPQVPSMFAYPCLHVRKCMSACPCLLSCMFACPFGLFFFDFAPVILHKSQVMSAYPCLHVHICISACPCFLSCRFACPCPTFLRFYSCHTPQVPSHVCISMSACP